MKSRVARETWDRRHARLAAMTPAQRVALAMRLGQEGVGAYMNIEPVCRVLDSLGAPYALIGAHAMAARGYPRFTVDVDLLTADRRVIDRTHWAALERPILPC